MDDLAERLAARDRLRRRMQHAITPQERMAIAWRRHEEALKLLAANPAGLGHFIRRNLRERSQRGGDRV